MDYKELIERLEYQAASIRDRRIPNIFRDAATAIETLLAEREAARQAVRLDRSRWEECADCWLWKRQNFCPECGRPLTEEAWAELERRIGGGI